jgi:hypothetical protein
MRRITPEIIAEMRISGYERETVQEAEHWLSICKAADEIADSVRDAFHGVMLGDGTGLRESDGIDDYAGADELTRLRAVDEKEDWSKISADDLWRCSAAPSFMNARGMLFHTPAFVVAELTGGADVGFIGRLISGSYAATDFSELLTESQRNAIITCIRFYGSIDPFAYDINDIESAVSRFGG